MGLDIRSRSNAFRGEVQQGRLNRRLREWIGERDEVESEHRGKVSAGCSTGCTVGIFRKGAGYIEILHHFFHESHLQGWIAFRASTKTNCDHKLICRLELLSL